jgi:putative ABC transport system substrate-binding protein
MKRREFIALICGPAAAWPLAARAQPPAMPVVGILSSASLSAFTDLLGAFRQGLKESGYTEGQNVAFESRWAEGHFERLPELAAELVQLRAAVIVTTGGSSNLAAKAATSTIPHVFLSQDDPVKVGLVMSLNRPGGNATGMSLLTSALVAKRLEFVRQLAPASAPLCYLMNPQAPEAKFHLSDMQAAARESGQQISVLNASSERDIDNVFTALAQRGGALIVSTDPFFVSHFHQIVVLAAYHKIPAIYDRREFVAENWHVCGQDHRRSKAVRPSGHAANQVRASDQSQDRQDTRARHSAWCARHCRRGDRIASPFAAVHESARGTIASASRHLLPAHKLT